LFYEKYLSLFCRYKSRVKCIKEESRRIGSIMCFTELGSEFWLCLLLYSIKTFKRKYKLTNLPTHGAPGILVCSPTHHWYVKVNWWQVWKCLKHTMRLYVGGFFRFFWPKLTLFLQLFLNLCTLKNIQHIKGSCWLHTILSLKLLILGMWYVV